MATFDAQQSTWTAGDVLHFARRAGFGLKPEEAATLALQSPAAVVDAWVDATADPSAFLAARATADVCDHPWEQTPRWAPMPYALTVDRDHGLGDAQGAWAWRMHYSPNPLQERLALFFHQLFATGYTKTDNIALTVKQLDLFRSPVARGPFGDLLVKMAQDPAMLIWLDTEDNVIASPGDVPNENFARELMELYSLGVDNGYSQADIRELAKAFTGWRYLRRSFPDPANPYYFNDGEFFIYHGQTNPEPGHPDLGNDATVENYRLSGTATVFGQTLDLGAGSHYGEDFIRLILTQRGAACAQFLAKRLLRFFVAADLPAGVHSDFAALIQAKGFHIGNILKALFKSSYFFDSAHRFALVEGPVTWFVRAVRALNPDLATASAPLAGGGMPRYPGWRDFLGYDSSGFARMGQNLLDPRGPNGWKDHDRWLNSDSYRGRTRAAWALAMKEERGEDHLQVTRFHFDTRIAEWFPSAPASPTAVFDRLVALLQPASIPTALRDAWLARIWTGPFAWDGSSQTEDRVRRTAFLILCAPEAQLF